MPSRSRSAAPPPIAWPDAQWKGNFRRRLLPWFRRHARQLPWRGLRDPYCVWVSEIMLQQTQVETVKGYFPRFLAAFPDLRTLAAASEQEVLRLWEGLGYYRRARQMHRAARQIVQRHGGQFPRQFEALRALPGIGRYTAGAVLSIAWDDRQPILEANTVRVLSRLLACRDDPDRGPVRRRLWTLAAELLPRKNVGDFNQALMELGSEICRPRAPRCTLCPARTLCLARRRDLQEIIPAARKKTRYQETLEAAVVVRRRGRVLLRRCGAAERWAGLWDYPRFGIEDGSQAELQTQLDEKLRQLTGLNIQPARRLTTIKHSVTRYRITLWCFEAACRNGPTLRQGQDLKWVKPADLEAYPLSVTGRKISRLVAGGRYAAPPPAGRASSPGRVVKPSDARSCSR